MEDINAKLLEKYQTLKKRRVSEFEGLSSGENAKLKSYQQAMEKLIGSLRKENDQLHNQMLLKEDEYAKCENLLMREKEKARQLSEEVDRLNNLLSERNKCLRENEKNYCTHETEDNITSTLNLSNKVLEGISRHPSTALAEKVKGTSCNDYDVARNEENTIALDNWELQVVPDCCKNYTANSGDAGNHHFSCVFQTLVESLFDAKISTNRQDNQPCISVIHQSSGYSFNLTWLKSEDKEEGDWFYHVVSLGTLERVALEWMREDITFSSAMCPIFFERLSRLVGRCH